MTVNSVAAMHSHGGAGVTGGGGKSGPGGGGGGGPGLGPALGGGGPAGRHDALGRLLADLCRQGTERKRGADEEISPLRSYVMTEARELRGEAFTRFLSELYRRIAGLLNSAEPSDKFGAVLAIDELIDVEIVGENASKISRFAGYLRDVFQPTTDLATMELASRTLGHLVLSGGALTADVVEGEVKRSLEWLHRCQSDSRRYAAVLILRQLAENAPAVFNVHVRAFIDVIWSALRDPKIHVRDAAVAAFSACLCLVEKRETRYRVQWYYRLFEETQRGLNRSATMESVHGSLLALGELMNHTGEFMLARYREVVETVLKFRDSKERLIRRAVLNMLPRIARFAPERFASTYLHLATTHLLTVLKSPAERCAGFTALGGMARVVCRCRGFESFTTCLPTLQGLIRDAIISKRHRCPEALRCIGTIAAAVGPAWQPYMEGLMDQMFTTGLSEVLVETLTETVSALPSLLPKVQDQLLDLVALALARQPFRANSPYTGHLVQALANGELQGPPLTRLALQTIGDFDFGCHNLLDFVRDYVVAYLDDADVKTRKAAALACCHLLEKQERAQAAAAGGGLAEGQAFAMWMVAQPNGHRAAVEFVVQRLLVAAVADVKVSVRYAVLSALLHGSALDDYLSQVDCLRSLFVALNDEEAAVRSLAIQVTGRLADCNPAYVMPALRRHLLHLLTNMENSPDSKNREESARLLGSLIRSAPGLVMPYVSPILKALVAKLKAQAQYTVTTIPNAAPESFVGAVISTSGASGKSKTGGEGSVVSAVLATLGDLACVAGMALQKHVADILPLILEALQDTTSSTKAIVAVKCLGQVVENTGIVVTPYMEFPQLMGLLLRLLSETEPRYRAEVVKTLGIVGALDPHTHKCNQADLQGEGRLESEGVRAQRTNTTNNAVGAQVAGTIGALTGDDYAGDLLQAQGLVTSSEEYYPTVAINALMRILRDPSMGSHHPQVVRSLMYIFQALGLGCVPYLPKVMPVLFNCMRTCEDQLREFMFQQLTLLVQFVRQHIRKYLTDLLSLIHQYWNSSPHLLMHILKLLAELSNVLQDDFRAYLPELLPRFIGLFSEAERSSQYTALYPALQTLEALGPAVEEHLHLLLPALVHLTCPTASGTPLEVRRMTLQSMRRMLPCMQLGGYASAIVHPLVRVLNEGPTDELRRDALDAICAMANALGPDFVIFVPTIRKTCQRQRLTHETFERIAQWMTKTEPPCMSDAPSWDPIQDLPGMGQDSSRNNAAALMPTPAGIGRLQVNEANLKRAWESSHRCTKDDWAEWMRHFSVELLKESPSPALRACHSLAQVQPTMARELFAAGFVSCWSELRETHQDQLVRSLEAALASPSMPPEIVTCLLNLAEFMEHDEKTLPLDTRTLGALAEKCHAFAKALHYKELEFQTNPRGTVEALISINNHLRQPEAAVGMLKYAQQHLHMELKESWYEKLQRWDDALAAYDQKAKAATPGSIQALEATLGRLRCLAALAEWERLGALCRETWRRVEPHVRREMAPMAAQAAWHMGQWDEMQTYVDQLDSPSSVSSTGAFLRAVLSVRRGDTDTAKLHVGTARELLGTELSALVGESYERAYGDMVRVQQLTELEEVIEYIHTSGSGQGVADDNRHTLTRNMWRGRLRGVQRQVEVWQALLSVRSLVHTMHDDQETWLRFASLCRKSGRVRQSHRTLLQLLRYDPLSIEGEGIPGFGAGSGNPDVMFAYLKHLWATGKRVQAHNRLQELVVEISSPETASSGPQQAWPAPPAGGTTMSSAAAPGPSASAPQAPTGAAASDPKAASGNDTARVGSGLLRPDPTKPPLSARAHLRLGLWHWSLVDEFSDTDITTCLFHLQQATEQARTWSKAWHNWALFNVAAMEHYANIDPQRAQQHVAPSVLGFFRSVALGQAVGGVRTNSGTLQDILRLLTLWFNYGHDLDVESALQEGFGHVSIDTWLVVIPQIIARIHTNVSPVRNLINTLLIRIGRHHPQALMYPLRVACKSQSAPRRSAAMNVVEHVRQHSAALVEQAQLVSHELIRIAILWHEMWHEALEEASRLYFGESNVEGMLNTLIPLHEMMDKQGPSTLKEIAFVQAYGRELQEAYEWCLKYKSSRKEAELHQAWDLYYHVFKRINKQLPTMTVLELQYVAPALVRAQGLELAVPGTYIAGEPLVTIAAFAPQLHVITSKQRPRKLTIHGGDGAEYMFLLKGHEDLRQDERVMQLFGLVNTLLNNDRITAERDLSIARYAVIPLSPNSGLIGWVPNCDTFHALIREYRDARKIPLNVEHRLMISMAPDYDHLTVIQKVEVFDYALNSTSGDDLHKVLWLKSRNSEMWLDRRTNYTRSLAVMSMVGYLLGLGDRHPSNLMLDRYSGKLLHIDFGDCFEASMNREKFPEKVPFRLTRMMIKAMEVSGIEGNFRTTCQNVMRVLRSNKDSVMAMLEAFVHDPLINWRLLNANEANNELMGHANNDIPPPPLPDASNADATNPDLLTMRRENRERELLSLYGQLGDATEVLNERAVAVMKRMSDKLTGRDFSGDGVPASGESDSIASQVHRLIGQATSHENLCQSYIGWCPFW